MGLNESETILDEGLKLIYPQKKEEWENTVKNASVEDLRLSLQIMKELSNVENEADIRAISNKYNGKLSLDVLVIVLGFSKVGPSFLIAYDPTYFDENAEQRFINSIIDKNNQYASDEKVKAQAQSALN